MRGGGENDACEALPQQIGFSLGEGSEKSTL